MLVYVCGYNLKCTLGPECFLLWLYDENSIKPPQRWEATIKSHDVSFMMTCPQYSQLTGSIPRGYGPVKTPVTFGSRVRRPFPWISLSLLGTNKTTTLCYMYSMSLWNKSTNVILSLYLLTHNRLFINGLNLKYNTYALMNFWVTMKSFL